MSFGKLLEVVGLATMVAVLGTVVGLLLMQLTGRMFATPSPGFFVTSFDAANRLHLALGAANIFWLWYVALLALGLAQLAGVPFRRAVLVVGGYWIVQEAVLIASPGMGQWAL